VGGSPPQADPTERRNDEAQAVTIQINNRRLMPIEKSIADSMLDPFRNMVKDLESRQITGEHFNNVKSVMDKMERYAYEMSDMVELSTRMAVEGIFTDFSNQYTKAIMAATQNQPTDDEGLLKQAHKAMLDAYNYHKDRPESTHILYPMQRIVEIGESGVSYPVYLRMAEEEGLYDAMKSGQQRPVIEFELDVAQKMYDPLRAEMLTRVLEAWDDLAAKAFYGNPDPVEFGIARSRIEWEYAPLISRWDAVYRRWDQLFGLLFDWVDSFTSFAPYDERWAGRTSSETRKNIDRTQECAPGIFRVRESIFNEYFNLAWNDIFTHETYLNEVKAQRIWYSDEVIALLKEAYPHLRPGNKPPSAIISKREALQQGKRYISQAYLDRWGKKDAFGFSDFTKFTEKYQR
jgi:hypothetical protein